MVVRPTILRPSRQVCSVLKTNENLRRRSGTVVSLSERLSSLHKTDPWRKREATNEASTDIATPRRADMAVTPETSQPLEAVSNQQGKSEIEQEITSEKLTEKLETKSTIEPEAEAQPSAEVKTQKTFQSANLAFPHRTVMAETEPPA